MNRRSNFNLATGSALAIILAFSGTYFATSASAVSARYVVSNGLIYVDSRYFPTAVLVGYTSPANGELTIAASVWDPIFEKTFPVGAVGSNALAGDVTLTSVHLPETIMAIGYAAFAGDDKLAAVILPNAVTYLAGGKVDHQNGHTDVTILRSPPLDPIYGAGGAYNRIIQNPGGYSLASVSPDYVNSTVIADAAFEHIALTSVTISDLVTTIGTFAFRGDTTLNSAIIGDSVARIGDDAFVDTSLASVNVPASVTTIGKSSFSIAGLTSASFLGNRPNVFGACDPNASFPTDASFEAHYGHGAFGFEPTFSWGYKSVSDLNPNDDSDVIPAFGCGTTEGYAGYPSDSTPPVANLSTVLGTAVDYSVLAGAAITAPASTIKGNFGARAAFTKDGGTSWTGAQRAGSDVDIAITDLTKGYAALTGLSGQPTATILASADLGGMFLKAGAYHSDAALTDSGTVTFDAEGDPNAVFIIQTNAALNTTAATKMVLLNKASAANIYWVSAAASTLGAASIFDGNIISEAAITVGAGSTVNGRALSVTAAVTLDSDLIDSSPTAGQTPQ